MTEIAALPLADPTDMIEMHRVFRNALADAPHLIRSVAPGDTGRAELVASYYDNVLSLLRAHHDGEDELLSPRLAQRLPAQAALVKAVAGQHHGTLVLLDRVEDLLREWQANPEAATAASLLEAMAGLNGELCAHLDAEERDILPLAAQCMNVAEWGELPAHGMQHFGGDKMWLILGLIRQQMSDVHRSDMDAHLPPPIASMWAGTGQALFEEFVTRLQG